MTAKLIQKNAREWICSDCAEVGPWTQRHDCNRNALALLGIDGSGNEVDRAWKNSGRAKP